MYVASHSLAAEEQIERFMYGRGVSEVVNSVDHPCLERSPDHFACRRRSYNIIQQVTR